MADSDGDEGESERMRGRVPESRTKMWLLLYANRWVVTGVVLTGMFVVIVAVGALDPAPLPDAVSQKDPVETLFQALITAIITGVTLVVTITQLVLSQELGAVGDQRERMEAAVKFREDVEDVLDAPVAPPEPAGFLRGIVEVSAARANDLADAVTDGDDEALRSRVETYVDSLTENAARVSEELESAEFGTFDVVFYTLDYNYSWKIYEGRRLQHEFEEALTEEALAALDAVVEVLTFFGPAREHFKTLYFEWELTNLSRTMLYAAVPALLVSVLGVLFLDNPGSVPGTTAGFDNLLLVVSAATTVALTPFVLLLAYVLRIATVAKRTLAIGPFVLRETDRSRDVDWK